MKNLKVMSCVRFSLGLIGHKKKLFLSKKLSVSVADETMCDALGDPTRGKQDFSCHKNFTHWRPRRSSAIRLSYAVHLLLINNLFCHHNFSRWLKKITLPIHEHDERFVGCKIEGKLTPKQINGIVLSGRLKAKINLHERRKLMQDHL